MEPTHPDKLVENATATSAGDSPDPDGKACLGELIPFRTRTGEMSTVSPPPSVSCPLAKGANAVKNAV